MRIVIAAVGRLKSGPERELCERYVERARKVGRSLGFSGPDLVEIDEGRARQLDQRREDEAVRLLGNRPAGCSLVVLDEGGKSLSTLEFADKMATWRDSSAPTVLFALGGADGHGAAMRSAADFTMSFGRQTWPHMLARIMLAEQIYRAMTVMVGHPYHRE